MQDMKVRLTSLLTTVAITALGGCFSMSRFVDGPLTGYLEQPLPKLNAPLAQELHFEWVTFNTAGGYSALVVSDRMNPRVKILSEKVGYQIARLLEMDREYSQRATLAALALLSEHDGRLRNSVSTNVNNMGGGGALVAAGQAGVALVSAQYGQLRGWIETRSGAIGPEAPRGSRLKVVMLRFFDSKPFRADSRVRVATLMILEDARGGSSFILEGSDVQVCFNSCDLFPRKPSAKPLDHSRASPEVLDEVLGSGGLEARKADGFDNIGGIYQYVLLHHGLTRLARQNGARARR